MRIRIRNFASLEVTLAGYLVVGENGFRKSDFLQALRLVLDSARPDVARWLGPSYLGVSCTSGPVDRLSATVPA